ncbi:WecB/TagA/CpsF family glycosyltransferase [Mycobacterium sp. IS-1742]|uniref:WecB/TagA/CpsF family glycosyltransferase n=1 Tax=Mycobacterium sp. IS-1742 TaxID=1772285 RepID=UPI0009E6AA5D|nr:WecB/TagA/CpsF family glycosyltransferase [Mycobacterium sp. IS-1742]
MTAFATPRAEVDHGDATVRVQIPLTGVTVTPMTAAEVTEYIDRLIQQRRGAWIANHNLHSLYVHLTNVSFATAYRYADRVLIDGWPVLALARATREGRTLTTDHRIGSTDWLFRLLECSKRELNIVAIGGTPSSSARAAEVVSRLHPNHTWIAFDGYRFARRDDVNSLESLDTALKAADLVVVGMGMPQQELWIDKNRAKLDRCVVANVGGCIDYLSGSQPLAPRWMGKLGCEWLFRLARSPRRLFYRYIIEPHLLGFLLIRRALLRKLRQTCG